MESKKPSCLCCSSTICCGVPIEKGCLIFAVINAIICFLGTIGSLGFLMYILFLWCNPMVESEVVVDWSSVSITVGASIGSGIAFTFAILLCNGLRKNKKRHIMAYLVFGMISVFLGAAGTLVFIWMKWGYPEAVMYAMIPLGVGVVYSVLLLLVYQTYVVLSDRPPIAGHTRLRNDFE